MKRFVLFCALLAIMIAFSSTALSKPSLARVLGVAAIQEPPINSPRGEEAVPLTDRTPWLVHIILISPVVALAWILFVLARGKVKEGGKSPREADGKA